MRQTIVGQTDNIEINTVSRRDRSAERVTLSVGQSAVKMLQYHTENVQRETSKTQLRQFSVKRQKNEIIEQKMAEEISIIFPEM
jgi:hypothetical protein